MATNETKNTTKPKKKKHYINNKDMLAEITKSHEKGEMTDELAKMIMLLVERYSTRYEYSNYQGHIEDMRSSAVLNIVRAWRSFGWDREAQQYDFKKFNNPFAYFTQAITHNFWQYTSQEKKHRLNRDALLIDMGELPSDTYLEDYEIAMEKEREERENPEDNDDDDETK